MHKYLFEGTHSHLHVYVSLNQEFLRERKRERETERQRIFHQKVDLKISDQHGKFSYIKDQDKLSLPVVSIYNVKDKETKRCKDSYPCQ